MFPFSMVCSIDGWLGCARFGNVGNASPSLATAEASFATSSTAGTEPSASVWRRRRRVMPSPSKSSGIVPATESPAAAAAARQLGSPPVTVQTPEEQVAVSHGKSIDGEKQVDPWVQVSHV